jgi:uncharacterized protein
MNKDISIMIELQRYWSNVLNGKKEIERCKQSIQFWRDKVKEKEQEISALELDIKNLRSIIKQKEIDIDEKGGRLRKLGEKKKIIKTEREMGAIESESLLISEEKGSIEEETLILMDELDEKNKSLKLSSVEIKEISAQADKDIANLNERIVRFELLIKENTKDFDDNISRLSPAVRLRFQKFTASVNGLALVKIDGQNCAGCNFQIPLHLIADASRDDKIVNCTNCGRFIYK